MRVCARVRASKGLANSTINISLPLKFHSNLSVWFSRDCDYFIAVCENGCDYLM